MEREVRRVSRENERVTRDVRRGVRAEASTETEGGEGGGIGDAAEKQESPGTLFSLLGADVADAAVTTSVGDERDRKRSKLSARGAAGAPQGLPRTQARLQQGL